MTPEILDWRSHREYERAGTHYRVLVDGEDVTDHCQSAVAGNPGSAMVLQYDGDGRIMVNPNDPNRGPLRRMLVGRVEFVPGVPIHELPPQHSLAE